MINNDFAFNTIGLYLDNSATTPIQAYVASNIFWENHDQTLARNGYAIYLDEPEQGHLQNNLFYGNGASDTSQADATNDLGNGFSPTLLGTTAAAAASNQGNFVGNPAFVFPIDPRPGSDGPANFFVDADFQLTSASAAIDNAWEATAIPTDLLGNSQVKISGGFGLPGYGPRDVGAFEFDGTGGDPRRRRVPRRHDVAGARRRRVPTPTARPSPSPRRRRRSPSRSRGTSIPATSPPPTWSFPDRPSTPIDPVHATSLTWIDADTVQFNLAGQFNTSGTLDVSLAPTRSRAPRAQATLGYSDNVVLSIGSDHATGSATRRTGTPTTGHADTTTGTDARPRTAPHRLPRRHRKARCPRRPAAPAKKPKTVAVHQAVKHRRLEAAKHAAEETGQARGHAAQKASRRQPRTAAKTVAAAKNARRSNG